MKKILAIMLMVVLSTGIFVTAFSTGKTLWEVYRPDYTVTFNGEVLNGNTQFPILECEGRTYLALEDWGNLLDASVSDNGASMRTDLYQRELGDGIVLFDDLSSAKEIGKALAKEKFPDDITEKTIFSIEEIELSGAFTYYSIYIFFDGSEVAEENLQEPDFSFDNADVEIRYFVKSGRIVFRKNQGLGDWVII